MNKLQIPYDTVTPDVDESAQANETAQALSERLAIAKATVFKDRFTEHLLIGADTVVTMGDNRRMFGKPHTFANAQAQLRQASGQRCTFTSGLCVYNSVTGNMQSTAIDFHIKFRQLTDEMIDNYLKKDNPLKCAGSFKSESLGIALVEAYESSDPSSVEGLPLIQLTRMLENEGVRVI